MSFPRATSIYLPIEVFDAVDPTLPETGATFGTGDVKIAKDGGALANTTNLPVEASNGVYWLQLTAAEMDASTIIVVLNAAGYARSTITIGTHGMPTGSIVANGSNTSSTFKTDRAEGTDSYWNDALILFTTGSLAGQVKRITGYTAATSFITVNGAFTATPSAGDRFVLVDR